MLTRAHVASTAEVQPIDAMPYYYGDYVNFSLLSYILVLLLLYNPHSCPVTDGLVVYKTLGECYTHAKVAHL